MKSYGQYCPIAQAAEVLSQRWTLLILRDLTGGLRRFNDLRRGVPRMSPTLLSRRLRELEDLGMVVRVRSLESGIVEYHPTPAALELRPIIYMLGVWGLRWVRNKLVDEQLDVNLLMWNMFTSIDSEQFGSERTVVAFEFTDRPRLKKSNWWTDKWWLVVAGADSDLCVRDPGFDVAVYVVTDLRTMTNVWTGDITARDALAAGKIELHGSRSLVDSFERWLPLSYQAGVPRPPEPMDLERLLTAVEARPGE